MRFITAAIVSSALVAGIAEANILHRRGDTGLARAGAVASGGLALDRGLVLGNGLSVEEGVTARNGLSVDGGLMQLSGLFPTFDDEGLLHSPEGRAFLTRVVECALSPEQTVVKTWIDHRTMGARTFEVSGKVGLAPQWGEEQCDEGCQRWVSACVLARTDVTGGGGGVNLRGMPVQLGMGADEAGLVPEATFYGNLFASPPRAFVCVEHGERAAWTNERLCGGDDCPGIVGMGACWTEGGGGCADARPLGGDGEGVYMSCAGTGGSAWAEVISTGIEHGGD